METTSFNTTKNEARKKQDEDDDDDEQYIKSLWYCPIFIQQSESVLLEEKTQNINSSNSSHETESIQSKPTLWLTDKESFKAWVSKSSVDWILINPDAKGIKIMRIIRMTS